MSTPRKKFLFIGTACFIALVIVLAWFFIQEYNQKTTKVVPKLETSSPERVVVDEDTFGQFDDQYEGGLNTYLFGDKYVSVEKFVDAGDFPIYGTACYETKQRNSDSSTECRSVFFEAESMVQLYVPKNTGFLPRNRILAFPEADPETFQFLAGFSGFDKNSLHFATYVRDQRDSINSRYAATSTPLNDGEHELLKLFAEDSDIGTLWLREPVEISGEVLVSAYDNSFRKQLGKDFVEISDENGPLLQMFGDDVHQGSVKVFGDKFLLFGREALYEVAIGGDPELLLKKRSQNMFHVADSENIYYLANYNGPDIKKYHIPTRATTSIELIDNRNFVRALNIFVSTDESRIYTRAFWNNATSTDYLAQKSGLLEIDVATGDIISEIHYEEKKHGSLFPFAVSPNRNYVYNIPIPYEGYMFDEMQYYQRDSIGNWSASSTVFTDFRLEVGGGWNARTGQWLLSPDQSLVATSDARELYTVPCAGMGDSPSVQNQLKVLLLDQAEAVVVSELGPWEEFALSHWHQEGVGLYYKVVSFIPGTCERDSVSDLKFIEF